MKRKLLIVSAILLATLLFIPVSALAHYDTISGELYDVKTQQPWQWGAEVEVWNCFSMVTIATKTVGPTTHTFSIDISSVTADTPLCVEVDFNPGSYGGSGPGNEAKGPYADRSSNSGNLDTGVYLAGCGPTAVTLADANAGSPNVWLPVALAASLLVGVGGALLLRRRRVA
jgi:hypothetical protein